MNRFDLQMKHGKRNDDSRRRKRNVPWPSAKRGNVRNQQIEIEKKDTFNFQGNRGHILYLNR